MASMVKPPSNNMGAQITTEVQIPAENRLLLDWVAFTLPNVDPKNAADLLHIDFSSFNELDRGAMGYKKSHRFGNITIYSDGSAGMGCHVNMSGQGCRLFESASKLKWRDLFVLVKVAKGSFSRLDIAFDTVDNSLTMGQLQRAVKHGHVRTQFGKGRLIHSYAFDLRGRSDRGTSLYFGSPTSRVQFRAYDKAAEQQIEGGSWVRFELQLRKERADLTAEHLISCDDLGMIGTGIINKYLAFINSDDSNRTRCSLKSWWSAWLQHAEKLKLTVASVKKQVHDLMNHIQKQYSATLATISEYLDYTAFQNFISLTVKQGIKRMSQRHHMILAASMTPSTDFPF